MRNSPCKKKAKQAEKPQSLQPEIARTGHKVDEARGELLEHGGVLHGLPQHAVHLQ